MEGWAEQSILNQIIFQREKGLVVSPSDSAFAPWASIHQHQRNAFLPAASNPLKYNSKPEAVFSHFHSPNFFATPSTTSSQQIHSLVSYSISIFMIPFLVQSASSSRFGIAACMVVANIA